MPLLKGGSHNETGQTLYKQRENEKKKNSHKITHGVKFTIELTQT